MILILNADSGKVTEVILKKGISVSVNEEIIRSCYDFPWPENSAGLRFTLMLHVDSRLKRIYPLL